MPVKGKTRVLQVARGASGRAGVLVGRRYEGKITARERDADVRGSGRAQEKRARYECGGNIGVMETHEGSYDWWPHTVSDSDLTPLCGVLGEIER
eukprot:20364-Rhodomonas_salina.1